MAVPSGLSCHYPWPRPSGEWIAKAAGLLRQLGEPTRGDGRNSDSLRLTNGSRLVALPGVADNIRGFSAVSLLIIDEAAYVSDELYHALNPMLAVSGGALWLMSTPNGQSGFFYDVWHRPNSDWHKVQVTAADCPRIRPETLEAQRLELGDAVFRREYMCEFTPAAAQVIPRDLLDRAFDPGTPALNKGKPIWRD